MRSPALYVDATGPKKAPANSFAYKKTDIDSLWLEAGQPESIIQSKMKHNNEEYITERKMNKLIDLKCNHAFDLAKQENPERNIHKW